jgi:hypothetical protein
MQNTHNNNISYLYGHVKQHTKTNKSFLEFWEGKTLDIYNKDTFYYIKKEYIVFQNIKPHPLSDILIHELDKINSRNFYEASKKAFPIKNLLKLFFRKSKTETTIKIMNKEKHT